MEIIRSEEKASELTRILLGYGFNSQFATDFPSAHYHLNQIFRKAEELKFELPSTEQRFFSLFHNLGAGDFDAAYLYDINFNAVALNGNPKLKQITSAAIDLTRLLPSSNLVVFYDNSRFAIPILSFYRNGNLIRQSPNAGSEVYHLDYWMEDEQRIKKRVEQQFGMLLELGIKSIS